MVYRKKRRNTMKNLNIKIIKDERISTARTNFYIVKVNGETILECITEQEVKETTLADILAILEDM